MGNNIYPEEEELDTIRNWDLIEKPINELLDYVKYRWNYADIGFFKLSGKRVLQLELHTGGWSGNEEILEALKENLFWFYYWQKSVRGGHYYFKIEKKGK